MPLSKTMIICLSFTLCAVEGTSLETFGQQSLRADARSDSIILPRPQQTLRICNAWPNQVLLSARVVRTGSRVENLPYKSCRDSLMDLQTDDQIDFIANETNLSHSPVGSFSIRSLANSQSTLLLVVSGGHHADVTFSSHTYNQGGDGMAQLVCLDTFQGSTRRQLRIRAPAQQKLNSTTGSAVFLGNPPANLMFGSVQGVTPGSYSLTLEDLDDRQFSNTALIARADKQYVVLRVGDEMRGGTFPEEVIAFPQMSRSFSRVTLLVWSFVLLGV